MSNWDNSYVAVFLSEKANLELAQQFFNCCELEPIEEWITENDEYSIDFLGADFLFSGYFDDFGLINYLFGKTYLVTGKYEENDISDSNYEFVQFYDPFKMKRSFSILDCSYGDSCVFESGSPYIVFKKEFESLAKESGIKPSWKTVVPFSESEEYYIENYDSVVVIPNPKNIEFCKLCSKYMNCFCPYDGIAKGAFPIDFGTINKTKVRNLISIARKKGYDNLVERLNDCLNGITHETEGDSKNTWSCPFV